jgi:hypothetical protein
MKKIKKLSLGRETIRTLIAAPLTAVVGGLSGNACTLGHTGCGACGPQNPSLRLSNCNACVTDVCTFEFCDVTVVVIDG